MGFPAHAGVGATAAAVDLPIVGDHRACHVWCVFRRQVGRLLLFFPACAGIDTARARPNRRGRLFPANAGMDAGESRCAACSAGQISGKHTRCRGENAFDLPCWSC